MFHIPTLKQAFAKVYPQYYILDSKRTEEYRNNFKAKVPYYIPEENIPTDPKEFFKELGPLVHPDTREYVYDLAPYQWEFWHNNARTKMAVKPQKSGMTTSVIDENIHKTLLQGNGMDCLIIAQNDRQAMEHIYTTKRRLASSEKYRKYLITTSKELYFKEEKTKIGVVYIKNPLNPYRPSRIIGLPMTEGAIWSWKNVFRIHMSDPAAANVIDDSGIWAAAESRLANTRGQLAIEGPPRGPVKKFYEYYEVFSDNHDPNFSVRVIDIEEVIKAGLVTRQFLQDQKVKLGPLYAQYYGSSFLIGVGNIFNQSQLDRIAYLGKKYRDLGPIPGTIKSIGIDPTYGGNSSAFAFVVCQAVDNGQRIQVIHSETFGGKGIPAPDIHEMESYAEELALKYDIFGYRSSPDLTLSKDAFFGQILLDNSNQFYIQQVKARLDKREYDDYIRRITQGNPDKPPNHPSLANLKQQFKIIQEQKEQKIQKVRPVIFNHQTRKMQVGLQYLGTTDRLIIDENDHRALFNEIRLGQQDALGNLIKPRIEKNPNALTFDLLDALKMALIPYDVALKE